MRAYGADGKEVSKVAIPKDSGTNISFGGIDGRMLYVTTNKALYAGRLEEKK